MLSNDRFVDAETISGVSGSVNGTLAGAGSELYEPWLHWGTVGTTAWDYNTETYLPVNQDHPDWFEYSYSYSGVSVWYKWTAPDDGHTAFMAVDPANFLNIGIFTGETLSGATQVAAAAFTTYEEGFWPRTVIAHSQGVTYHILVQSDYGWEQGAFELTWEAVTPPENDNLADATVLTHGTFTVSGTTHNASIEPGEKLTSSYDYGFGASVWYRLDGPCRLTNVTADLTQWGTLAVYLGPKEGSVGDLHEVNSTSGGPGVYELDEEELAEPFSGFVPAFATDEDQSIFIQISGYDGRSIDFSLTYTSSSIGGDVCLTYSGPEIAVDDGDEYVIGTAWVDPDGANMIKIEAIGYLTGWSQEFFDQGGIYAFYTSESELSGAGQSYLVGSLVWEATDGVEVSAENSYLDHPRWTWAFPDDLEVAEPGLVEFKIAADDSTIHIESYDVCVFRAPKPVNDVPRAAMDINATATFESRTLTSKAGSIDAEFATIQGTVFGATPDPDIDLRDAYDRGNDDPHGWSFGRPVWYKWTSTRDHQVIYIVNRPQYEYDAGHFIQIYGDEAGEIIMGTTNYWFSGGWQEVFYDDDGQGAQPEMAFVVAPRAGMTFWFYVDAVDGEDMVDVFNLDFFVFDVPTQQIMPESVAVGGSSWGIYEAFAWKNADPPVDDGSTGDYPVPSGLYFDDKYIQNWYDIPPVGEEYFHNEETALAGQPCSINGTLFLPITVEPWSKFSPYDIAYAELWAYRGGMLSPPDKTTYTQNLRPYLDQWRNMLLESSDGVNWIPVDVHTPYQAALDDPLQYETFLFDGDGHRVRWVNGKLFIGGFTVDVGNVMLAMSDGSTPPAPVLYNTHPEWHRTITGIVWTGSEYLATSTTSGFAVGEAPLTIFHWSSDGVNWTNEEDPFGPDVATNNIWEANGKLFALVVQTEGVHYSTDEWRLYVSSNGGDSWTQASITGAFDPSNAENLAKVIWVDDLNLYVGCGSFFTNDIEVFTPTGGPIITSTNGTTWTIRNNGLTNVYGVNDIDSVAYSPEHNHFVAYGTRLTSSITGEGAWWTSDDAINWDLEGGLLDAELNDIVWSSELDKFIGVGFGTWTLDGNANDWEHHLGFWTGWGWSGTEVVWIEELGKLFAIADTADQITTLSSCHAMGENRDDLWVAIEGPNDFFINVAPDGAVLEVVPTNYLGFDNFYLFNQTMPDNESIWFGYGTYNVYTGEVRLPDPLDPSFGIGSAVRWLTDNIFFDVDWNKTDTFIDDFERSNSSSLGSNEWDIPWNVQSFTGLHDVSLGISGGKAVPVDVSSSDGGGAIAWQETYNANGNINMSFSPWPTSGGVGSSGLIFRMVDENNYWRASHTGLYVTVDGVETHVATYGNLLTAGHTFMRIRLEGTRIRVYKSSTSFATLDITNQTHHEAGTKHGFYMNPGTTGGLSTWSYAPVQSEDSYADIYVYEYDWDTGAHEELVRIPASLQVFEDDIQQGNAPRGFFDMFDRIEISGFNYDRTKFYISRFHEPYHNFRREWTTGSIEPIVGQVLTISLYAWDAHTYEYLGLEGRYDIEAPYTAVGGSVNYTYLDWLVGMAPVFEANLEAAFLNQQVRISGPALPIRGEVAANSNMQEQESPPDGTTIPPWYPRIFANLAQTFKEARLNRIFKKSGQ